MSGGGHEAMTLLAAFIPLLIVVGIIALILFVTGARAARQQRLLQRLLENSERQTALLKRLEERLSGTRND
ncbi:YebO family protein [Oceanicola sp. 502str15]|uniref:YebO family protein n=1 Tax=Oceanicola sp. 502str15 TaxID=2696061 RepID=UPI002095C823|nr:YebO family protein [Oceanicola sp. 502str15]MCO6382041.1 hypothetical protein [Oceanicola sp. 502str15]